MNYSEKQEIHGFRVLRAEKRHEPEGNSFMMEHIRTGAKLFWLDNGAENMVFSITFRTLPEDSTGVFHILEHSVLCGSRRYPMKEPFVELLKSSMNTFLNAMTFPDMTMYPVSSRNPKDLMNLVTVYLDAVFAPLVMEDRKRFCQEGWHFDRNEEGNPEYCGVVYNEMKGAMSDADTLIERELAGMLFPDTYYGHNSGGDPEDITDLTWEKFKEQYERWYHPSNAKVYLDGNVPIDEILLLLDQYFSCYDPRNDFPDFAYQEPKGSEKTILYELGHDENKENKAYLTLARITGTWRDRTLNMAKGILCDVLSGSNEAPLKRAVLEKNLAQDISVTVDDTGLQSWIEMHAEHVTDGKEQEILNLLKETGEKIQREGLDQNAVEASLNRAVYHLREEEEPQGIGRCIRSMGTWLYGGEPEEALETEPMIRQLQSFLEDGTFDSLAVEILLNQENTVILHTLPSLTIGDEKRRKEKEKIVNALGKMTDTEKTETLKLAEELESWHCTPESKEDLTSLPLLSLQDADIEPEWTETETEFLHGVKVLIHRIPCGGIVHLRAYFTLTDLSLEELTQAALFSGMLGRLPTKKYSALKLQQEIKRCTGSFGFAVVPRTMCGEEKETTPSLVAFVSALEENAEEAQELLAEVLMNTVLLDQDSRIEEMMMQNEIGARQRISGAGHLIAIKRSLSSYSAEGAVKNALDGDRAIRYIHAFSQDPVQWMPGFLLTAEKILKNTFCSSRMTISITAGNYMMPSRLAFALSEGTNVPEKAFYQEKYLPGTGYRIPSQIGFAARGYRLSHCGIKFSGSLWLAGSILTLDYLWNKVRVQGGAYSAGMQIDRAGNLFSYSFRDPSPAKTLRADGGASAFLKDFACSGEILDKYIISALNELNPLLSPRDKGALADARMMTGYTREDNERIRKELLNTTPEQLAACGEWLDSFAEEGSVCVVAHVDALRNCENLKISDL